ncbi:MAG TPA: hypothetical protein VEW48_21430 [Thermoanaerobaculia bacterium]|nr:hypothetical protein [Thermoanaerobaculia bacterium]
MEHLIEDASLERFAAGTASREEACAITRHLLKGCLLCAKRLRELIRPPVVEADYGPAVDAFVRTVVPRVRGPRPAARSPQRKPKWIGLRRHLE